MACPCQHTVQISSDMMMYGVFIRYCLQNLHTAKELKKEMSAGVISINYFKCRIWGSHSGSYEQFIFWVITLCNPLRVNRRFRGTCCHPSPGSENKPSKKPARSR
jgi:hypothetical protein